MSDRLKLAFEKASQLPEEEQEHFAALLLAEMEDEAEWKRKFEATPHVLEALANRAREQFKQGKCSEL